MRASKVHGSSFAESAGKNSRHKEKAEIKLVID
jgi:hypothetical protein